MAKYTNQNPLHRLSLNRFHDTLAAELRALTPHSILDFGCGEGFTLDALAKRGVALEGYEGLDLRAEALAEAQTRWPGTSFVCRDLFDSSLDSRRFDVTLALEVFEHLYEPERTLERLASMTRKAMILSVPHEPWFQLVNLTRGRDLIRLGNHPEHVQHWNAASFHAFVSLHAEVIRIRRSFPFVIATARPRR